MRFLGIFRVLMVFLGFLGFFRLFGVFRVFLGFLGVFGFLRVFFGFLMVLGGVGLGRAVVCRWGGSNIQLGRLLNMYHQLGLFRVFRVYRVF